MIKVFWEDKTLISQSGRLQVQGVSESFLMLHDDDFSLDFSIHTSFNEVS